MREDGEMARVSDLEAFAARHKLGIVQIAELIQYRMAREVLIRHIADTEVKPRGGLSGTYKASLFASEVEDAEYLVLALGDVASAEPVLVRVQVASFLRDLFSFSRPGDTVPAAEWLRRIEREGRGVMIYILPRSPRSLASELGALSVENEPAGAPLRDIGLGSQVLVHMGIRSIRLLTNNPRRLAGIEGYGIHVVECVRTEPSAEVFSLHEREAK
jgi:3,4-dihydroxy 2-butanone 4-phosphate synthase/GTP cyclohydrolase II